MYCVRMTFSVRVGIGGGEDKLGSARTMSNNLGGNDVHASLEVNVCGGQLCTRVCYMVWAPHIIQPHDLLSPSSPYSDAQGVFQRANHLFLGCRLLHAQCRWLDCFLLHMMDAVAGQISGVINVAT